LANSRVQPPHTIEDSRQSRRAYVWGACRNLAEHTTCRQSVPGHATKDFTSFRSGE
jgi:hypothetical protein